jgi:hypothetical protein
MSGYFHCITHYRGIQSNKEIGSYIFCCMVLTAKELRDLRRIIAAMNVLRGRNCDENQLLPSIEVVAEPTLELAKAAVRHTVAVDLGLALYSPDEIAHMAFTVGGNRGDFEHASGVSGMGVWHGYAIEKYVELGAALTRQVEVNRGFYHKAYGISLEDRDYMDDDREMAEYVDDLAARFSYSRPGVLPSSIQRPPSD